MRLLRRRLQRSAPPLRGLRLRKLHQRERLLASVLRRRPAAERAAAEQDAAERAASEREAAREAAEEKAAAEHAALRRQLPIKLQQRKRLRVRLLRRRLQRNALPLKKAVAGKLLR